ncbi:hypothetical protein ACCS72_37835, partial [Rhizobium ruizarguesonis]
MSAVSGVAEALKTPVILFWLISALLGASCLANSFSGAERRAILEAALKAGIPADRILPGTGVVDIPETVELTRHALSLGVTKVVM